MPAIVKIYPLRLFESSGLTSVLYAYDATGKILSVTYPNEIGSMRNALYTYDRLHRILTEVTTGVRQTYTYDKAGNRLTTKYGGTSRLLTYGYDALNRLHSIVDTGS